MANTSRLVFLALAVVVATVHGYEVASFEAKPEHPSLGSTVTLMAKGDNAWETCKFVNPSGVQICKFRNENGDKHWKLAEGEKAKCVFHGKAENYECGLMVTADECAAGKWEVQMEQWELGFYEGKNIPLSTKTLELEIDGAKPEECAGAPKPTKPASNATTTTAGPTPAPSPYNGGDSSTKTSMGLVAAATLMALLYKY